MKALIIDKADPSVGLFEQQYWVDVPFEQDEHDAAKEYFRTHLAQLYSEYADGKVSVFLDYELPK